MLLLPPRSTLFPYTTLFRSVTLKNEEVISIIILLASILTGFIGWNIYDVSLASVFARWIVLVIACVGGAAIDRKSTRLNSSHVAISYAVFCLKKKTQTQQES